MPPLYQGESKISNRFLLGSVTHTRLEFGNIDLCMLYTTRTMILSYRRIQLGYVISDFQTVCKDQTIER